MQETRFSRRKFIGGTGAAATIGLAGCLGGLTGGNQDAITIGLQADLTGAFSQVGYWQERTVTNYVESLNQNGGIDGREIDLVVEDTATDPGEGSSVMRRLTNREGADFVIGSQNAAVAISSIPIAKQTSTPYFPLATGTSITGSDGNRWTFRNSATADHMTRGAFEWARSNDEFPTQNWTIIYQDYSMGQQFRDVASTLMSEVQSDPDKQILEEIAVPLGTSDLNSYLNNVAEETEVLFSALVPPSSISFLSATYDLDTPGRRLSPVQSIETVDVSQFAEAGEGATFLTGLPRQVSQHDTEPYRNLHETADVEGADVPLLSYFWVSWETLSMIKLAVEESGWTSQDDHQELIEWLEQGHEFEESNAFPQGTKQLRGEDHQTMMDIYVEQMEEGELIQKAQYGTDVTTYPSRADLSSMSF